MRCQIFSESWDFFTQKLPFWGFGHFWGIFANFQLTKMAMIERDNLIIIAVVHRTTNYGAKKLFFLSFNEISIKMECKTIFSDFKLSE